MHSTTLPVKYSAVPAVIIIKKDGDHIRITPIPLGWALVWRLLGYWLSGFEFRCTGWARLMWNRLKPGRKNPVRAQLNFISWLIAPFYKIILGHGLAGTSWRRSLAWGILGV